MSDIAALLSDPSAWAALVTLIVLEVVLGIDNLIFISILSNKLPEHQQKRARRMGILLALGLRLVLLSMIAWLVGLTAPVIALGISGPPGAHGEPTFETAFSLRDLILISGGLFLVWKATTEIHHNVDSHESDAMLDKKGHRGLTFASAIAQILALDMVFSIDSILTAVGMSNPTVVMLARGFLLMIGVVLIADGFGVHVPKGYIYTAMAFSAGVEMLNIFARRARERKAAAGESSGH